MTFKEVISSPGLWLACSVMVIVIFSLAIIYFRLGIKRANEIGIARETYKSAIRSAAITSIGPSLSPVIVLMSMIAVVGAPTAWMRLNDVGAARTELAIVTMSSGLLGIDPSSADFGVQAFSYASWGMALNNMGWFTVALLLTHRMAKAVDILNEKHDRKWINLLMSGATFGVTGYLLANQIILKAVIPDAIILDRLQGLLPALAAAAVMIIINNFVKSQRLQELALGIAMLAGMLAGQLIYG